MHELSVVMSIIEIAAKEAGKANAHAIEEIELEIGTLAGIEMDAFDFAWQQAVKDTVLEHAERKINHVAGEAQCMDCGNKFSIEDYYDACPACNSHLHSILQGKELRVKSLIVV